LPDSASARDALASFIGEPRQRPHRLSAGHELQAGESMPSPSTIAVIPPATRQHTADPTHCDETEDTDVHTNGSMAVDSTHDPLAGMRDLLDAPADEVAVERTGCQQDGAPICSRGKRRRQWVHAIPERSRCCTREAARDLGGSGQAEARRAVGRWDNTLAPGSTALRGRGRAVHQRPRGAWRVLGEDGRLVDRLASRGGWNCEQENG
jgi:hypothetical protein